MNPATQVRRASFPVSGMTCQGCARKVREALLSVEGVADAEVNFGSRSASVELAPDAAPGAAIEAALDRVGFGTPDGVLEDGGRKDRLERDVAFSEEHEDREQRATRDAFLIAVPTAVVTIALQLLGLPTPLSLATSTACVFGAGHGLLKRGLVAGLRGAPDMNTLVALGTLAGWLGGVLAWALPDVLGDADGPVRAAVIILTLVLLGRWMEGTARRRAGDAVKSLLSLSPPEACVVHDDGSEERVPVHELGPGALVRVRPGARLPADGTVREGRSEVDESALTGESFPVEKAPGDEVHAGTLNGTGSLLVDVTHVGSRSTLGRIAQTVREAQGSRAPVQDLADRVSAYFVPAVLVLAIVTAVLWLTFGDSPADALARVVAVLVVACPCALGLATPAAVIVGSGRAASEGALIKNAATLQRLAEVDTVVLDKTGTLTAGEPRLRSVRTLESWSEGEDALLRLTAEVELQSEQPLARGILAAARERGLELSQPEDFEAEPGRGVRGRSRGHDVWIGSPRAAAERETFSDAADELVSEVSEAGETPVVVVVDGAPAGVLGLFDEARATSAPAVRQLRALSLATEVLSGDHQRAVDALAADLGIQQARGACSPQEKAEHVAALEQRGARVAFVGDGVNDAPALARAHVGVAVESAADVALEAADAALLREDPEIVPRLVTLARRTMSTIRANLVWAFGYNLVALPLAAGALAPWTGWSIPPSVAAGAMAASSLGVVLNSLRLKRTDLTRVKGD